MATFRYHDFQTTSRSTSDGTRSDNHPMHPSRGSGVPQIKVSWPRPGDWCRYTSFVMSKLVPWETPFTSTQFPSVALIVTSTTNQSNNVKAIVMPQGTDKYPKYLVNFGEVIAFTCFEEAHAPERDFAAAKVEEENLCAYQYLDSPWLKSYEAWIHHISFPNESLSSFHYLIFGGDNNIEIITTNKPTIDIVEEKTILQIEQEV